MPLLVIIIQHYSPMLKFKFDFEYSTLLPSLEWQNKYFNLHIELLRNVLTLFQCISCLYLWSLLLDVFLIGFSQYLRVITSHIKVQQSFLFMRSQLWWMETFQYFRRVVNLENYAWDFWFFVYTKTSYDEHFFWREGMTVS